MKNELAKHVGRRIKMQREQKGLTQAQLATLTLKSVETISNFERASVVPGLVALEALAQKLGCPVSTFFEDTNVISNDRERSPAAQKVLNSVDLLPEEDIEILAELADALGKRGR